MTNTRRTINTLLRAVSVNTTRAIQAEDGPELAAFLDDIVRDITHAQRLNANRNIETEG